MSSEKPVTPTIPIIITTPLVDRELSVIEEMISDSISSVSNFMYHILILCGQAV